MIKIKFYNATIKEIFKVFPLEGWKYSIVENPDFVVVVDLLTNKYLNES